MSETANGRRPLLAARSLGYGYPGHGRQALSDIHFALGSGERVGLVGPNGTGKSTLLLQLNGVLQPASGALWLDGALTTKERLPELRRRVGLCFQQADDMLFTTRVRGDVAFGPRQLSLSADEVETRVADSLAAVGVAHLADRAPHHLSAGEKGAVAIAAVLSMRPEVLLLDEPTSNLDPHGRRTLLALLRSLGKTLVVASHDLEFVLALCERVVLLDEGRIVADGDARTVLGDEPLMLAHGLERPHSLTPHGENPHRTLT